MDHSEGGLFSSPQSLSLNSLHFVVLAVFFVVLLRGFQRGIGRRYTILAFNLYFFHVYVAGWFPWAMIAGMLILTYGCAMLRASQIGARLSNTTWAIVVLMYWVFLFLVKEPRLLATVNPFHYHPVALVGISYMVFRCIAFIMDADAIERRSPLSFANFVLFFPTLLAGPIETYERYQQFEEGEDLDLNESPLPGLHQMVNGFIKKFVLADNLAVLGLTTNCAPGEWSRPALWLSVLLLPVLLYLDFSGYCDIMIGLVRLSGFRLAENFDRPWLAKNIQEFWNRWHITLSQFIRNYIFNPLWHLAVVHLRPAWHFPAAMILYFFTMVLIGLWHAPTWGFLTFGVMHGFLLVGIQVWHRYAASARGKKWLHALVDSRIGTLGGFAVTYCLIAISMVLWSRGVDNTWTVVKTMFGA